jgi:SOUL heme-binding protein
MKTGYKIWIGVGAFVGGIALAAVAWGPFVSDVEQPKYTVVERDGNIEIRDYAPMIVAEAEVAGTREAAIRKGFRTIADYIFGNNLASRKITMTAPVTQQAGEKIAMTAPVTQQGDGHDWQIRFVMPASYTIDTLPRPRNTAVRLKQVGRRRFAVIRFFGIANSTNLRHRTEQLQAFLKENNLNAGSAPVYAFYNPPWTLPVLRRNEVLIEISS